MSTALGFEMKTTPLPMVADKDVQRVADATIATGMATAVSIVMRTLN
jgi:hypothetical protein